MPGTSAMGERLLLLGATGDLAMRHLFPALAHLRAADALPPAFEVLGVAREPWSTQAFRALVDGTLERHAAGVPQASRSWLVKNITYQQADLGAAPDLRSSLDDRPAIAYLALPPDVYASAARALRMADLAPTSRVVVEKPFGRDLTSARELTRLLDAAVGEANVYRVDHFLHHQVVQDLWALRAHNPIFEAVWGRAHVDGVEVVWEERAGVADRVEFYDRTGALRDMVQSHLLQVLALVAMEIPTAAGERAFRDAKAAALRQVPSLTPGLVAGRTMRARYAAGTAGNARTRGYLAEAGVDPDRQTETYASVRLSVDTPRWHGVPFVLSTGKAVGSPRRRVSLSFRGPDSGPVSSTGTVLTFDMAPDTVGLEVTVSDSAGLPALQRTTLTSVRPDRPLPPSARMLLDVLRGEATYFVRGDEVEESWRIVDSVRAGWRSGQPPLQEYPAGSMGPLLTL